jgi:hypothetical protein
MLKSVPKHLWPTFTVFIMVLVMTFTNKTSSLEMWTFNTEHVLRKPAGIALDKHRNVYVAGYETNNVIVVSPDGKNCRHILTK